MSATDYDTQAQLIRADVAIERKSLAFAHAATRLKELDEAERQSAALSHEQQQLARSIRHAAERAEREQAARLQAAEDKLIAQTILEDSLRALAHARERRDRMLREQNCLTNVVRSCCGRSK